MNNKKNRKGFTIVELVIVIAVIAILATVLIPTFSGIISKANASKNLQEARNRYTEYLAEKGADAKDIVYIQVGTSWYKVESGKDFPSETVAATATDGDTYPTETTASK